MKKKGKRMIIKILIILVVLIIGGFGFRSLNNVRQDKVITDYLETHDLDSLYNTLDLQEYSLERAGCKLHFYGLGDPNDSLVILLHAAFSDHNSFHEQYEALSKDYFVVGLDVRAHGKSQPIGDGFTYGIVSEDIKAVIEFFGKKKASLIGVSMGGELVQEFNYRNPLMVNSSVIVGCVSLYKDPGTIVRLIKTASIQGSNNFSGDRVKRFMSRVISDSIDVQAKFYHAMKPMKSDDIKVISKFSSGAYREIKGYKIEPPVLLMHGSGELGFVQTAISEWSKELPKSMYVSVDDCGHLVNMENPEEFIKEVLRFLKQ